MGLQNLENFILEYIKERILDTPYDDGMIKLEHAVCRDGFIFSMQLGSGKYCNTYYSESKKDVLEALEDIETLTFEVGYPTHYEELLQPYKIESVIYKLVPFKVVLQIIEKHKGLKEFEYSKLF